MTARTVALSEVATIERQSVAPDGITPGELYVGLESITGEGTFAGVRPVEPGAIRSAKFRFDQGHILYGKLRPYLAKIAQPSFRGVCSTDILPIRPSDAIDARYLLHFLRSPLMVAHADKQSSGANLPRLSPKALEAFQVPLPPLAEQRRVAGILDAAEDLRAKRQEALTMLDALVEAVFADRFGGGGTTPVVPRSRAERHPSGWSWVPIREVATMGTGHTPDRENPAYWGGDIGWVNLNEIRHLDGKRCSGTSLRITAAGVANSSAVVHPAGTVCFSRTASIGFVTIMGAPMATSQDFVTWTCSEALNPEYLMRALILSRKTLRASSSGSTHKTIYVRDAERFSVLLPPRGLQDEFVDAVEAQRRVASSMSPSAQALDDLAAALRQSAFAGEL